MDTLLFKIFRHRAKVRHNGKYLRWFRANIGEPHHILRSHTGIKLNDFLLVARDRAEHGKEHDNPSDFSLLLLEAMENLFDYIEENK